MAIGRQPLVGVACLDCRLKRAVHCGCRVLGIDGSLVDLVDVRDAM
jgi:hypothetical protein